MKLIRHSLNQSSSLTDDKNIQLNIHSNKFDSFTYSVGYPTSFMVNSNIDIYELLGITYSKLYQCTFFYLTVLIFSLYP